MHIFYFQQLHWLCRIKHCVGRDSNYLLHYLVVERGEKMQISACLSKQFSTQILNFSMPFMQPDSFIFAQRHNRDLKLCDFGLTQRMEPGGVARVLLGNGEYLAPEIINYEPVSFAADMWSMGAVAYTMWVCLWLVERRGNGTNFGLNNLGNRSRLIIFHSRSSARVVILGGKPLYTLTNTLKSE